MGHGERSIGIRVSAALFYAISSLGIIFVNKFVLTSFGFPSFGLLALSQYFFTLIPIRILKALGYVHFPPFSWNVVRQLYPLPLLFLFNALAGLGSTKMVNLAMFVVLRRFTILLTMIGEYFVLGKSSPTLVKFSVFLMILGALVAASNDLMFDWRGYLLIMVNNFCSALNAVYSKHKLDAKSLSTFGLLYYNSLLSLPVLSFIFLYFEHDHLHEIRNFEHWSNPAFLTLFTLASLMGFILNLSIVICTEINSALTTIICGSLKNVITTYLGMIVGGDYIFSVINFSGLNISIIGSLLYSWTEFISKRSTKLPL